MPAFMPEVLAAFKLHDFVRLQVTHTLDMRQREGIGLVCDLNHQAADHGQGQRYFQMEAATTLRSVLQHNGTAQQAHHVLNGVQPHATPRNLGHDVTQAEPRQKQKGQQFFFAQLRHRRLGRQLTLNDSAAQTIQINTGPVIAQFKHQQTGLMGDAQADQTFGRFTRKQPLLRSFDAVIDGITQQMDQWRFKLFQYIAVDLSFFAFDFQANLLAQGAAQITHHALLPDQDIGKRAHTTSQCGVVEQLRTLTSLPAELVELGGLLTEQALRLSQNAPGICQRLFGFMTEDHGLEMFTERIHCPQVAALHAFEAL